MNHKYAQIFWKTKILLSFQLQTLFLGYLQHSPPSLFLTRIWICCLFDTLNNEFFLDFSVICPSEVNELYIGTVRLLSAVQLQYMSNIKILFESIHSSMMFERKMWLFFIDTSIRQKRSDIQVFLDYKQLSVFRQYQCLKY